MAVKTYVPKPYITRPTSQPDPRRLDLEQQRCDAIQSRLVVELRYKSETQFRDFHPYSVYQATTSQKVLVYGKQTKDHAEPFKAPDGHNFEVGLINGMRVTGQHFEPDPRLNPFAAKGKLGTICGF